jgi:hypothetical protein
MANSPAVTSLSDSSFYLEFESDIVDERCEFNDGQGRYELPSRPVSRLGFNRAMLDTPPHIEDESLDFSKSRGKACKRDVGQTLVTPSSEDTEMGVVSDSPAGEELEPNFFSFLSFSENSTGASDDVDMEPDSDCSAYEDSDEEIESLLSPSPPQPLTPIPFPVLQPEPAEWITGRPKFSCLPSPLSPRHTIARTFSFRHTPTRHMYHHHGYSRHALLHLKWFWATREVDSVDPQTQLRDAKAYGGLSILGLAPKPFQGPPVSGDSPSELPPLSIHPRLGDFSALRDPYCMHIDRYFVGLPIWTMAKTLWMFDVHLGVGIREGGGELEAQDGNMEGVHSPTTEEDDSKSEVESLDISASLNFSDDSDTTLVESDSDSDHSPCLSRFTTSSDISFQESADVQLGKEASSSPSDLGSPNLEKGLSRGSRKRPRHGNPPSKFLKRLDSRSPSPDGTLPPWATCWYRRWDLLMHLVRHDQEVPAMPDVRDGASLVAKQKIPKFFIGEENESGISEESEDEDEDDLEDILIMVKPLYHDKHRSLQV